MDLIIKVHLFPVDNINVRMRKVKRGELPTSWRATFDKILSNNGKWRICIMLRYTIVLVCCVQNKTVLFRVCV
jgi:hypothetical protein